MKKASALILVLALMGIVFQSCGSSHEVCPAYTKAIKKQEVKS